MAGADWSRGLRKQALEGQILVLKGKRQATEFAKHEKETTLKQDASEESERLTQIDKEIAALEAELSQLSDPA